MSKPGRKPSEIPLPQRRRLHTAIRHMDSAAKEIREAVRDAHDAGGSIRAIAEEIDRAPNTIQKWLRTTDAS